MQYLIIQLVFIFSLFINSPFPGILHYVENSVKKVRVYEIRYTFFSRSTNTYTLHYNRRNFLIRSDRTFISYSKDTLIQSFFDIYKYDQLNRLVDFSTFEND